MSAKNEELFNKIISYYQDGYTKAAIARMTGVSRQRVGFVLKKHKETGSAPCSVVVKDSSYQKRKLQEIAFPNIRSALLEKNITFVNFCRMISEDKEAYYYKEKRFVTGESTNTSLYMISKILEITGLSYKQAFEVEANTNEDCCDIQQQ